MEGSRLTIKAAVSFFATRWRAGPQDRDGTAHQLCDVLTPEQWLLFRESQLLKPGHGHVVQQEPWEGGRERLGLALNLPGGRRLAVPGNSRDLLESVSVWLWGCHCIHS